MNTVHLNDEDSAIYLARTKPGKRTVMSRMMDASHKEMTFRAICRAAQPGNNRAAVRETVRMIEAGKLLPLNDLVI